MKKLIPLIFGLMLPLSGAFADNFVDQAVEFCRSKGGAYSMGSMVEEGNKYCRQVTCKKTTSDRLEIPEGAPGPEANVEATKRVCVDKSIVDGSFNTNGSGSGSGSSDAGNSTTGSSSGAATTGAGAGAAGAGAGGADSYICEELIGEGRIEKGGLCYNECRPKRAILGIIGRKKEGFERKSCVECLLRYPGVYSVKAEYLPKDKNGKVIGDKSVSLGKGVGVKTGVIICKDSKGNIVHINGTMCPPGSVVHSGTISTGSGGVVVGAGSLTAGSAGGAIIIAGSAGGSAGIQRPAYCDSSKKKDLKKCEEWMNANRRFLCASSAHAADCIGSGSYHETMSRYDTQNCVNCGVGSRKQSTLSGIAEIVGAIAPPLAQFGSAYVGARAYQKGQEAWAGAAVKGFEQCQISQNNYMQYLSSNELPGLSPAQQAAMGCNGFQLGGFAGMQNPGLSGWYGAGYTPGMIGGMMGPWGGYDPYGGGMMAGGMMAGGMMTGGYPGGMMAGGMVNGISIAGGINSGMAGGYPGGMIAGGMMAGGYPGGMMAGGYPGGMVAGGMMAGGYPGGMMTGGYPGGMMTGGMVNGISIAGGVAGGYPGGMMTGGYYPGGMMTGGMVTGGMMAGGMMAGGYYPGGMMAGGMAVGGMAGGYPGGMMAGGMMAGGMSGGFMESQQAANYDAMLQQQGMGLQVAGGGMGTPYGAGGYPMNGGYGTGMYGAGW